MRRHFATYNSNIASATGGTGVARPCVELGEVLSSSGAATQGTNPITPNKNGADVGT